MDSKTKTVGTVLSEIKSLERADENLVALINALNNNKKDLDLPFEPTVFLMGIRAHLGRTKDALKYELYDTEITSDLFRVVS